MAENELDIRSHLRHSWYSEQSKNIIPTVQVNEKTGQEVTCWSTTKEWGDQHLLWPDKQYLGVLDTRDFHPVRLHTIYADMFFDSIGRDYGY